ncbi:MAG: hypothetical protein ABIP41_04150 [Croceibacterium sp.]
MIGKLIGAIAGAKAADHMRGVSGTTGAVLGAALPIVLRRLSLPAMLAIAAGGYAFKRYQDKQERRRAKPKVRPSAA